MSEDVGKYIWRFSYMLPIRPCLFQTCWIVNFIKFFLNVIWKELDLCKYFHVLWLLMQYDWNNSESSEVEMMCSLYSPWGLSTSNAKVSINEVNLTCDFNNTVFWLQTNFFECPGISLNCLYLVTAWDMIGTKKDI